MEKAILYIFGWLHARGSFQFDYNNRPGETCASVRELAQVLKAELWESAYIPQACRELGDIMKSNALHSITAGSAHVHNRCLSIVSQRDLRQGAIEYFSRSLEQYHLCWSINPKGSLTTLKHEIEELAGGHWDRMVEELEDLVHRSVTESDERSPSPQPTLGKRRRADTEEKEMSRKKSKPATTSSEKKSGGRKPKEAQRAILKGTESKTLKPGDAKKRAAKK